MNPRLAAELIEEHRLDWGLDEVMRGASPPDLRASILSALQTTTGHRVPFARRLRAAATLLLSIGVVTAVALWNAERDPDSFRVAHDPVRVRASEIAQLPPDTSDVIGVDLEDEHVAALVARCPDIVKLELSTTSPLRTKLTGDGALAHIATLRNLRSLRINAAESLTNAGLAHLTDIPLLEELALVRLGEGIQLGLLRRLPLLTSLTIHSSPHVLGPEFDLVFELTQLESLDLSACSSITSAQLTKVARLTKLRELRLDTHNGLTVLPPGVEGKRPYRDGYGVDRAVVDAIASLPNLTSLSLRECKLRDAIEELRDAPALVRLDVGINLLLEQGSLEEILAARPLTWLDLRDCYALQPSIVDSLRNTPSLRYLNLSRMRWLDEATLAPLREMPNLELVAELRRAQQRRQR